MRYVYYVFFLKGLGMIMRERWEELVVGDICSKIFVGYNRVMVYLNL